MRRSLPLHWMPGRCSSTTSAAAWPTRTWRPLVAARGVPFVAMHWRGHSHDMQARAHYDDVVEEVTAELSARVEALVAAGIRPG